MVTLIKTWSGPNQTAFSSSSDQAAQYRQFLYALKTAALSAGWTVERSSNGTTASAADNWASVADVVFGTEASQAHSWIALIPPAGKGNPSGGIGFRWLINCNEANTDTTPQLYSMYLARGTYGGGSTTTRPTITGNETAVLSLTSGMPWPAAIAGSFCIWTTTDGDIYWGIKGNAETFFRELGWIRDDPTNAIGNYALTLFADSGTTDVVTATNLQNGGNHRSLRADGTTASTSVFARCIAFEFSLIPNGQLSSGERVMRDVEIIANGNAAGSVDARQCGLLVDVRGLPANAAWDVTDQNDDGAALPYELRGIGDLMIPCNAAIT